MVRQMLSLSRKGILLHRNIARCADLCVADMVMLIPYVFYHFIKRRFIAMMYYS